MVLALGTRLSALALVVSLPAQESKPLPTTAFSDAKGRLQIHLPSSWKVKANKSENGDIMLSCSFPGSVDSKTPRRDASITAHLWPGEFYHSRPRLRGMALRYERTGVFKDMRTIMKPVPHVVLSGSGKSKDDMVFPKHRRWVYVFKREKAWTVGLGMKCHEDELEWLLPQFFRIWADMKTNLERYPNEIKGLTVSKRGSVEFHVQKGVPSRFVSKLKSIVTKTQRSFTNRHGAIVRPKNEPLQFVVFTDHKAYETATPTRRQPEYMTRRIYRWVFDLSDKRAVGAFVGSLTRTLFNERYGGGPPWGPADGEADIAQIRAVSGRKAPAVPDYLHERIKPVSMRMADISKKRFENIGRAASNTKNYAMLFHYGGWKYRNAYTSFLKEYGRTYDGEAAAARHLYSLDQDQMMKDCQAFLDKRVTVLEQRKR